VNTNSGLLNSSHWNPAVDPLDKTCIDFTVPAWFGVIIPDLGVIDDQSFDLANSQVFVESDWLPFVIAMQVAQASGEGNVITMKHTAAANAKFGLEGGRSVTVVWYYNGRALGWEAMLSEVRRLMWCFVSNGVVK
jgi:hypothetical protein